MIIVFQSLYQSLAVLLANKTESFFWLRKARVGLVACAAVVIVVVVGDILVGDDLEN